MTQYSQPQYLSMVFNNFSDFHHNFEPSGALSFVDSKYLAAIHVPGSPSSRVVAFVQSSRVPMPAYSPVRRCMAAVEHSWRVDTTAFTVTDFESHFVFV